MAELLNIMRESLTDAKAPHRKKDNVVGPIFLYGKTENQEKKGIFLVMDKSIVCKQY